MSVATFRWHERSSVGRRALSNGNAAGVGTPAGVGAGASQGVSQALWQGVWHGAWQCLVQH